MAVFVPANVQQVTLSLASADAVLWLACHSDRDEFPRTRRIKYNLPTNEYLQLVMTTAQLDLARLINAHVGAAWYTMGHGKRMKKQRSPPS